MANSTNQVSGDAINAIRPDLEAFASLWAALRANYEGTNITKTVARLLHMYQPEDGIQAYERLLNTLFVLLEDFDGNGLRLLASMVPPPKGSLDETIKEVFFKATGFVRIDAPIFYQNYPLLTSPVDDEAVKENHIENVSAREKNSKYKSTAAEVNQCSESPQMTAQEFYPFRGFPQTEIMFSQGQKNCKSSYNVATDVKNYFKGDQSLGQCFDHPGDSPVNSYKMNWLQTPFLLHSGSSLQPNPYRDLLVKTVDHKYLRVPVAHCSPANMHYFTRPCQIIPAARQNFVGKSMSNGLGKNVPETQVSGALNNEATIEGHPDLSEHNYGLPENQDTQQTNETSKIDSTNCSEKSMAIEDFTLENLTVGKNLSSCIERFLNRAKNGIINSKKNLESTKTSDQSTSKIAQESSTPRPQRVENNSPVGLKSLTAMNRQCSNETLYNCSYQPTTMSELAAYKRQYYDALLSIQRAKMVVANSLTHPMQECNDYDVYHPDYWLYQQPQRLIYGQRYVQPEYSGAQSNCIRSNDWLASYPSRVSHETPLIHSSALYNSRFMYSQDPMTQSFDCSETKIEAKKRKLENIVVKLKEGEIN